MLAKPKHKKIRFGFSASSYHIEGGNIHSDWHEFEQRRFKNHPEQKCGMAADYWNTWKSDHDLMSEAGVTVFRTSVEWSRICPKAGVYDQDAIDRYKLIFADLKKRRISLTLTLFHYVSPKWFSDLGGFKYKQNLHYFREFTERVLHEFHEYIDILTPINESLVYGALGHMAGEFPPEPKSFVNFIRSMRNLLRAHMIVAEVTRSKSYTFKLSTSEHYRYFRYANKPIIKQTIGALHNYVFNKAVTLSILRNTFMFPFGFGGKITSHAHTKVTYTGLQSYPAIDVILGMSGAPLLTPLQFQEWRDAIYKSKFRPDDLKHAIMDYSKFGCNIIISECGIDTSNDEDRITMLHSVFDVIRDVRSKGIRLQAFMFFTLFDCFEWSQGYSIKMGLVEVNRKTLEKTPKPSYYTYQKLVREYQDF